MTLFLPVVQLFERRAFEATALRAAFAGVAAGLLQAAALAIGARFQEWLPVALAVVFVCAQGSPWDRWLLRGLAAGGALALSLLDPSAGVGALCAGAAVGVLLVLARSCARGAAESVGGVRLGPTNYLLGALLGAVLLPLGLVVAEALEARGAVLGVSKPLRGFVEQGVAGLFLCLSALGAHLALRANAVEARAAELQGTLSGAFARIANQALVAYRAAAESLQHLPADPARNDLAETLSALTLEALELAQEWVRVEAELEGCGAPGLLERAAEHERDAQGCSDVIAKGHLEAAGQTLREQLEDLRALGCTRDRMVARLKAQVALLERARGSLLSARGGHAQVRAAELTALARRLAALTRGQGLEGELAVQVAVGAELAAAERQRLT